MHWQKCVFLFSFFLCLFLVATKTINKHRTPTTTNWKIKQIEWNWWFEFESWKFNTFTTHETQHCNQPTPPPPSSSRIIRINHTYFVGGFFLICSGGFSFRFLLGTRFSTSHPWHPVIIRWYSMLRQLHVTVEYLIISHGSWKCGDSWRRL